MTIKSGASLRLWAPVAIYVFLFAATGLSMPGRGAEQLTASSHALAAGSSESSSLAGPYRKWLDEDVRWIITPRERSAFVSLQTDAERLQFIRQFWTVRNPEPDSSENKFKEEHYRRLAFANAHFATGSPGWISDRGHIYIVYGPPDSIDAHPSGGSGEAPPFEVWHYNVLQAHGRTKGIESAQNPQGSAVRDVDLRFVDTCHCGDYKLTSSIP